MKKILSFIVFVFIFSCAEKLMEKPEHLIPKETMVGILEDLAILNAARTTNVTILRDNNIEPTGYIFEKYGIDSVQFMESDRYYASLPSEYEAIYVAVEGRLETERLYIEEQKKIKDSLKAKEREAKRMKKKVSDSLP